MNNQFSGTVKFFNEGKGFGFIAQENSNNEFFVHVSNITQPIQKDDKVMFETREGRKGPEAFNVKKI